MNPRIRTWAMTMTMAVTCAVAACTDRMPTEPTIESSTRSNSTESGEAVKLLKRTEPLRENLSASAVIGPRGGHLRIHRAGLRVDFPPGAVHSPTRITVTALRGDNVAYQFAPHGLVFRRTVTLSQNLHGTAAWKTSLADDLQGSYFERLVVDPSESWARSLERRPAKLKDYKNRLEFGIEHFSGYMVSVGEGSIKVDVVIDITAR